MKRILFPAVAGALVAMSGAALADTAVSAVTDLNVRAGPGPQYPVIGVLAAGQSATLNGCIENSKWCTIAEAGGQGWVYSDYVTADFGGSQVVLTRRPADAGITVVTPPADSSDYPDTYTGAIVSAESRSIPSTGRRPKSAPMSTRTGSTPSISTARWLRAQPCPTPSNCAKFRTTTTAMSM